MIKNASLNPPPPRRPAELVGARTLAARLRGNPLTLLCGPLGAARSNALRDGVMPLLQRRASDSPIAFDSGGAVVLPFPDRRAAVEPAAGSAAARGGIEVAVLLDNWLGQPLAELHTQLGGLLCIAPLRVAAAGPTLPARLQALADRFDVRFLLICDRFEDALRAAEADGGCRAFIDELSAVLRAPRPAAHVLLSIGDDAMALLNGFRQRVAAPNSEPVRLSSDGTDGPPDAMTAAAPQPPVKPPQPPEPPRPAIRLVPPAAAGARATPPAGDEAGRAAAGTATVATDREWTSSIESILARIAGTAARPAGVPADGADPALAFGEDDPPTRPFVADAQPGAEAAGRDVDLPLEFDAPATPAPSRPAADGAGPPAVTTAPEVDAAETTRAEAASIDAVTADVPSARQPEPEPAQAPELELESAPAPASVPVSLLPAVPQPATREAALPHDTPTPAPEPAVAIQPTAPTSSQAPPSVADAIVGSADAGAGPGTKPATAAASVVAEDLPVTASRTVEIEPPAAGAFAAQAVDNEPPATAVPPPAAPDLRHADEATGGSRQAWAVAALVAASAAIWWLWPVADRADTPPVAASTPARPAAPPTAAAAPPTVPTLPTLPAARDTSQAPGAVAAVPPAIAPQVTASAQAIAPAATAAAPNPPAPNATSPITSPPVTATRAAGPLPSLGLAVDGDDGGAARLADDLVRLVGLPAGIGLNVEPAAGWADALAAPREGQRLAVVRYDALAAMRRESPGAAVRLVTPLVSEELYFIARADSPMAHVHDIERATRINVGPAQGGRAVSAQTAYQRLFDHPMLAGQASFANRDAALHELLDTRAVDVIVVVDPQPSAWLARLPAARLAAIKLLPLAPDHPTTVRARRTYLPAVLHAGAAPVARETPTLSVMSFLVVAGTADGSVPNATAAADARGGGRTEPGTKGLIARLSSGLCRQLDSLRRDGHPKWQELQPGLPLPAGWPYAPEAAAAFRQCGAVAATASTSATRAPADAAPLPRAIPGGSEPAKRNNNTPTNRGATT